MMTPYASRVLAIVVNSDRLTVEERMTVREAAMQVEASGGRYLADLPDEIRRLVARVRAVV